MARKSLRCRLGRHIGHEAGGTVMFTCTRCKRPHWQPERYRRKLRAVEREADLRVAGGDFEAVTWAQDEVRRVVKGTR